MEKERKKKENIAFYFIKIFIVFIIIFLAQRFLIRELTFNLRYASGGINAIGEMIWVVLSLIVVLIFKDSHIFSQKKERIKVGLKLAWPLFVIGGLIGGLGIIGIISEGRASMPEICNTLINCICIGIVEEFLCRGWLFNEFLKRFSDSKKNIILSIVLSSLVFGLAHLVNISGVQSAVSTIVQVVNAFLVGIVFALIYYRTKNIWTVVIIHASWDFFLDVSGTGAISGVVRGTLTPSVIIARLMMIVLVSIAYIIYIVWLNKHIDIGNNEGNQTNSKKKRKLLPILFIIMYILAILSPSIIFRNEIENYEKSTQYEVKPLEEDFEISYFNYSEYTLKDKNYEFRLHLNKDEMLVFDNLTTEENVILYDSKIDEYLLYEDENYYFILAKDSDNEQIIYGQFSKDDISQDKQYLEKIKNEMSTCGIENIEEIGIVKTKEHVYPIMITNYSRILYISQDGTIYVDKNRKMIKRSIL